LHRAQARGGIGGEVGIAGPGGEDDDTAFFEMSDGAAADVRLGQLLHVDRALHAREDAQLFQRVLERQRVDHRRQHAHVIGARAIHSLGAGGDAAEDVSAPDHDADLDAQLDDVAHLLGDLLQRLRGNPVLPLTHQRLAAQLQEDELESGGFGGRGHGARKLSCTPGTVKARKTTLRINRMSQFASSDRDSSPGGRGGLGRTSISARASSWTSTALAFSSSKRRAAGKRRLSNDPTAPLYVLRALSSAAASRPSEGKTRTAISGLPAKASQYCLRESASMCARSCAACACRCGSRSASGASIAFR